VICVWIHSHVKFLLKFVINFSNFVVCSTAGIFLQTLPLEDMQRECHYCRVCCNAVKVFITEWVKIPECPVNLSHMNGVSSSDPFLSNTVDAY
jgi:hypothetical protein